MSLLSGGLPQGNPGLGPDRPSEVHNWGGRQGDRLTPFCSDPPTPMSLGISQRAHGPLPRIHGEGGAGGLLL